MEILYSCASCTKQGVKNWNNVLITPIVEKNAKKIKKTLDKRQRVWYSNKADRASGGDGL